MTRSGSRWHRACGCRVRALLSRRARALAQDILAAHGLKPGAPQMARPRPDGRQRYDRGRAAPKSFILDAFSLREPVSTSFENAITLTIDRLGDRGPRP